METGESISSATPGQSKESEQCDHNWELIEKESPEGTIQKNEELANHLKKSPSKHGVMRGYQFENRAIETNMKKINIKNTSALFRCSKCKIEQDVDIAGTEVLAEAKSRNSKKVKDKKQQTVRLLSIQMKIFNPAKKPLAKLDGSLDDVRESAAIYQRRGFDVEIVS